MFQNKFPVSYHFSGRRKYLSRFVLNIFILFGLFILFYSGIRKLNIINEFYVTALNYYTIFLLELSVSFVKIFGYEAITFGKTIRIVENLTTTGVYLDRGCLGRNIMLGYSAVILAFPGNFISKIWYIPTGIIILIFLNILRISGLALIFYCCPEYGNINHNHIFKYTAWIIIFIMWIIWINKLSYLASAKK